MVAWKGGPLTLWGARRGAVVSEARHSWRHIVPAAVAMAGSTVLSAVDVGPVQAWDAATGRCLRTLDRVPPPGAGGVRAAAVSADSRVAVIAMRSGQVAVRSLPAADYQAPWRYARPRPVPALIRAEDVLRQLLARASDLAEHGRLP